MLWEWPFLSISIPQTAALFLGVTLHLHGSCSESFPEHFSFHFHALTDPDIAFLKAQNLLSDP